MLIPGNSEEIAEFTAIASKKCLRQIDISLPKVMALVPSHKFFEMLYNRLSTDLCLWEPSAPEFCAPSHGLSFHDALNKPPSYGGLGSAVLQSPIPGMFIMCKSGIAYGENSFKLSNHYAHILNFFPIIESDTDSDDGESGAFSYMRNHRDQWKAKSRSKDSPSKMCVSVNIGKGFATLFCHLKVRHSL